MRNTKAKYIKDLINDLDYGWRHPELGVIHVNTKQFDLVPFLSRKKKYVHNLSQKKIVQHFSSEQTYYFTGDSRKPVTLLMIDIDCQKSQGIGTTKEAVLLAEYLKNNHFDNLYFEPSTNGKGVHGYLLIETEGQNAQFINACYKKLEAWIKRFVSHANQLADHETFDVEDVEIKGHCLEVSWSGGQPYVKCGSLAKIPRCADTLHTTTKVKVSDFLTLPQPKPKEKVRLRGSCCFAPDYQARLSSLGRWFSNRYGRPSNETTIKNKIKVTNEDIGVFLSIVSFCEKHANVDGSQPFSRYKALWQAMYNTGATDRAFNPARLKCIRDYFSQHGFIEWEKESYWYYCAEGRANGKKGEACQWQVTTELIEAIEETTRERITKGFSYPNKDRTHTSLHKVSLCGSSETPGLVPILAHVRLYYSEQRDNFAQMEQQANLIVLALAG